MGHLFSKPEKTKGDEVAYRKPTEASRKSISESIKSQSIKTDDGEIVPQKIQTDCCRRSTDLRVLTHEKVSELRSFHASADSFLKSFWDPILSTGPQTIILPISTSLALNILLKLYLSIFWYFQNS